MNDVIRSDFICNYDFLRRVLVDLFQVANSWDGILKLIDDNHDCSTMLIINSIKYSMNYMRVPKYERDPMVRIAMKSSPKFRSNENDIKNAYDLFVSIVYEIVMNKVENEK